MSATSTRPRLIAWARRLVSGEPHQIIGDGPNLYMLRWYVIPKNRHLNIYVHKFLRSDEDRALHDHPWWFASVILQGCYDEVTEKGLIHRFAPRLQKNVGIDRWVFHSGRRVFAFRPAEHRHRVALFTKEATGLEIPCWTLIVTGPKSRPWGFWCAGERFIPWREWGAAGCGETE